jgi:hypothetical protein
VVYRITLRSNPRILGVYALIPVLIAAGVGSIWLLGPLFGIIALLFAGILAWSVLKLARRQLATRVETLTDELLVVLHGDEKVSLPWDAIRLTGFALEQREDGTTREKDRRLFVYNEKDDKLIVLTDEFEGLDGLAGELRERAEFREIALLPGETLKEKLRELVGSE